MERTNKKKMSRTKKWLITLGSLIGILILGIGGYALYLYNSVQQTVDTMHQPIDRDKSEKRTDIVEFKEQDPISFLLMGVDEREGDRGRSDTLIVLTVNPNEKSTQMVSIPRDTRTEIVGKGFEEIGRASCRERV